jgi:hypothetical protein
MPGNEVLRIYQPTSGILAVTLPEGATQIAIANLVGHTIKQAKATAGTVQKINIHKFLPGIYILKVETAQGFVSAKFIVK